MSRIGKRIITVPENVNVDINENKVTVKGPKGELSLDLVKNIVVKQEGNTLTVEKTKDDKFTSAMHGTTNANIQNMIIGVSEGYKKGLEINGVGYRFTPKGNTLTINAGYSHPVNIEVPEGLTVKGPKGELSLTLNPNIEVKVEENIVKVTRNSEIKTTKQMHGTTNALIANMIKGVKDGYEKALEIIGVGYRFVLKGNVLEVSAGYSHKVNLEIPEGITVESVSATEINVKGVTLVSASSLDKDLNIKNGGNIEASKLVGAEIAKKAKKAKITKVVFDRGGYLYHGRVKALADAARENGLEF